eukprot:6219005-Pyramimonas_sp.AAC.1
MGLWAGGAPGAYLAGPQGLGASPDISGAPRASRASGGLEGQSSILWTCWGAVGNWAKFIIAGHCSLLTSVSHQRVLGVLQALDLG